MEMMIEIQMMRERERENIVLSICKLEGTLTISVIDAKQNENGPLCPHLVIPIPQSAVVPTTPGTSLTL